LGIAPQLTAMNGRSVRGLAEWMARATSSLPVPLSPVIKIVASVTATFSTSCPIFWMSACSPISAG